MTPYEYERRFNVSAAQESIGRRKSISKNEILIGGLLLRNAAIDRQGALQASIWTAAVPAFISTPTPGTMAIFSLASFQRSVASFQRSLFMVPVLNRSKELVISPSGKDAS